MHLDPEALVRIYRRGGQWWAGYHEDGRHIRKSLGTRFLADARLMAGKIEQRLRGKEVGIEDPFARHASVPIADHVEAFRMTLVAKAVTEEHVERVLVYLRAGIAAMGVERLATLDLAAAAGWLEREKATGIGPRAVNVRAQSLRSFGRWLLETRRTPHNPFLGLRPQNVEADRRRVRRALTADEVDRLIAAAARRPLAEAEEAGYDLSDKGRALYVSRGAHRALVYAVAAWTGLRRGEMTRVRWRDLRLDPKSPEVLIPAGSAKSRREQSVPLAANVLGLLTAAREARKAEGPDERVFPAWLMPQARTFAKDLRAAGIEPRAEDGTVADFHGMRVNLATRLSEANVPLTQAQRILRHSSPVLTASVYTRPSSTDLRAAIDRSTGPSVDAVRKLYAGSGFSCREVAETDGDAGGETEKSVPAPECENGPQEAVCAGSAVVGAEGLEPPTPCVWSTCSTS
jgi:integrase